MKKLISIAATMLGMALLLPSCSEEINADFPPVAGTSDTQVPKRSVSDAIDIANSIAESMSDNRSRGNHRVASSPNCVKVLGSRKSRAASDTLIYVVEYDNDNGYALIAAPQNATPILAIIDEGSFDEHSSSDNGGFQQYLNAAENYVSTLSSDFEPTIPIKPHFYETITKVEDTIAPRVTVRWGQNFPEGYFCPNKLAGCVQTAMAQVMSVFEHPKRINLTYPNRDSNTQPLYWDEIKSHKQSISSDKQDDINNHLAGCPLTMTNHLPLARLCRELGHLNDALYLNGGTSATLEKCHETFRKLMEPAFSVGPVLNGENLNEYSMFQNMKSNGGVLMLFGTDSYTYNTPNQTGHTWIADGGMQVGTVTTKHYTTGIGIDGSGPTTVSKYFLNTLFHFNWGWNGLGNGYFLPDVYNPANPEQLDWWLDGYYDTAVDFSVKIRCFAVRNAFK